jgi:hypothetical protein
VLIDCDAGDFPSIRNQEEETRTIKTMLMDGALPGNKEGRLMRSPSDDQIGPSIYREVVKRERSVAQGARWEGVAHDFEVPRCFQWNRRVGSGG